MGREDLYSRVDYRRFVAWPARIRREGPFLLNVLARAPVPRVLDLGCGTGEHGRFLAGEGFAVVGVDSSESMLEKAGEAPLPAGLRFELLDLTRLGELADEPFGAAICLGNTLPHLRTEADLERFARGLHGKLLTGAPVVVQILNYDRIFARGVRHLPLNFRPDGGGEAVFLRLMDLGPGGEVVFIPTTLRVRRDEDPPVAVVNSRAVRLRGWRRAELEAELREAGFREIAAFGGFDESPHDPETASDLVLVAHAG